MIDIKVLGPGCPKCEEMKNRAEQAAQSLGIEFKLEKLTDIKDIMAYGIMTTPALVVDGEVKVVGSVPSVEDIAELLKP